MPKPGSSSTQRGNHPKFTSVGTQQSCSHSLSGGEEPPGGTAQGWGQRETPESKG